MHVCQFSHATGDGSSLGVVDDGQVTTIDADASSLDAALVDHDWSSLRTAATGSSFPVDDVTLHAPVDRPRNLLGVGLNYAGHAEEGGYDVPEEPVFFAKSPSSITDPDGAVTKHDLVTDLHYEGEFGFVVGETARRVDAADALDHVFGFVAGNDVTARDMQLRDLNAANPWYRSKSMDTFTPLGPWVTPVGEDVDPASVAIETRLNDEVVQSSNTDDLVFDVPTVLAYITDHVTLHPGDIVLTGTPSGVGSMEAGDEVVVEIEGVGALRNEVRTP
ncbi:fumarylacetoacetate hydrolase family protein [Halomarina oriensis]|uniref:DUF2437 domain-containing protein n=1 Tax=Halomarina oriensis TaxID=671145 RepID=A0A6B0GNC8_9EURY|nr:fumarylacetoacetate hydrolase family protein [Halomarina oriensis]MWG35009.1 DUF2437 domain-containing protein [Halomarina oriensis]